MSCEMPGWMKHKLESRLPGEKSIASDMQITQPSWQKVNRKWRASWWKWKRREKNWLETQHSKNEDHGTQSHHFKANRWQNNGNTEKLYFLGLQNHWRWWLSPEMKRSLLRGRKAMTNLGSILKSRDITLLTKVCIVKDMIFPVVVYECESWTIRKAECQKIDAFELWRLLWVSWIAKNIHWKDWY